MIGHHITEHARQKILREIAVRAQKHVFNMTYQWCVYLPVSVRVKANATQAAAATDLAGDSDTH
jgi:hypothetical protein